MGEPHTEHNTEIRQTSTPEHKLVWPVLLTPNPGWAIAGAGMILVYFVLPRFDPPLVISGFGVVLFLCVALLWPVIVKTRKRKIVCAVCVVMYVLIGAAFSYKKREIVPVISEPSGGASGPQPSSGPPSGLSSEVKPPVVQAPGGRQAKKEERIAAPPSKDADRQELPTTDNYADALGDFIVEGNAINQRFADKGDTDLLIREEKVWTDKVGQDLENHLGRSYASQFRSAQGSAWMGCLAGRSSVGCGYWQRMKGKLLILSGFLDDVRRKPTQTIIGAPGGVTTGNITQGTGSIAQIGGSGNIATINAGLPPRALSEEQRQKMVEVLAVHKHELSIGTAPGDEEAADFAIAIADTFEKAGWTVNRLIGRQIQTGHAPEALNLTLYWPEGATKVENQTARMAFDALRAAGLGVSLNRDPQRNPDDVHLFVRANRPKNN